MLTTLLASAFVAPPAPWGVLDLPVSYKHRGNPYDAATNDVRVELRWSNGSIIRPAFWDGTRWRVTARVPLKTDVSARPFVRNGATETPLPAPDRVFQADKPEALTGGMVRIDRQNPRLFVDDARATYTPIGINVGWQNPNWKPMAQQFADMRAAGMNWARIWACHWDGKNPMWIEGRNIPVGDFAPEPLKRWDDLVSAAERNQIRFQFVLFHHGPYSLNVNSNWNEHPWNVKNGGFLNRPAEFFTLPRAKQLARNWIRYAVARYGHSNSVLSYELFNEVEWVEGPRTGDWAQVHAWHREMFAYLRDLDRSGRPMTTSSEQRPVGLYEAADFYNPHAYPVSVRAYLATAPVATDKPFFYGEIGPGGGGTEAHKEALRDGLWTSALRGHSGAACYWFWDNMTPAFYQEYRQFATLVGRVLPGGFISAKFNAAQIEAPAVGPLTLRPGRGWGENGVFELNLPQDGSAAGTGTLSSYFNSQAGGNRALFPRPLTLKWRAPKAGSVEIALAEISRGGARLEVTVNGRLAQRRDHAAGEGDRGSSERVSVSFPAGEVTMVIASTGADWFRLASITVPDIGPGLQGETALFTTGLMARATQTGPAVRELVMKVPAGVTASGPATLLDLDTGRETTASVQVTGSTWRLAWPGGKDVVVWVPTRAAR